MVKTPAIDALMNALDGVDRHLAANMQEQAEHRTRIAHLKNMRRDGLVERTSLLEAITKLTSDD